MISVTRATLTASEFLSRFFAMVASRIEYDG